MADIFISYSKQEPEATQALAADLEEIGYSTWWDTSLLPGERFPEKIRMELEIAKAVIVIWSEGSVRSEWVYAEAQLGQALKKLISLHVPGLDLQRIPMPFGARHIEPVTNRAKIYSALEACGLKAKSSSRLSAEKDSKHWKVSNSDHSKQIVKSTTFGQRIDAHDCVKKYQTSSGVQSVAFSPDGLSAVSGGGPTEYEPGTSKLRPCPAEILLWDIRGGRVVQRLDGHTARVTSVAFNKDGREIATGSHDGTVKIWEPTTGKEIKAYGQIKWWQRWDYPMGGVDSIIYSSDSQELMAAYGSWGLKGGMSITIAIWNTKTGHLRTIAESQVLSIAYSKNRKAILSASYSNRIKLWDAITLQLLREFKGNTYPVRSVAFSPDGNLIVSGGGHETHYQRDGNWYTKDHVAELILWSTDNVNPVTILKGHTKTINAVIFTNDGRYVVTGSDDGTIMVWNATDRAGICRVSAHRGGVKTLAISPDRQYLLSGGEDIYISDGAENGMKLWRFSDLIG